MRRFIKGFPSTMMDEQLNIIDILRHAAKFFPKREIVSRRLDGTLFRYNYSEAFKRVSRLANALEALGVKAGDRVSVISWNTHRFYELFFGVPGIGATLLPLNLRLHPSELTYVLEHSGVKLVFVDESLLIFVPVLMEKVKFKCVVMGDGELPELPFEAYSYEELLKEQSDKYDFPVIDERSACTACYTSGTTGKPKGVFYSHRAMVLHALVGALYLGVKSEDTYLQLVPLFHANGWGTHFGATLVGAKLVFPGRFTIEDLKPIVDLMLSEGVTITAGAPAIFMPLLKYLQGLEPKPKFNMRAASGASEPPLAMMKGLKEFGIEIIHAYGATETSPLVSLNFLKPELKDLSDEEKWELRRKQGVPVFGVDVKLVDESGRELPWDGKSIGELCIRGPWITGEYYKDPRTFESFLEDETGKWWKSGDAATIDEHGYIKIVDRIKDLIKSGGEWISSVDLENWIMAHPKVYEACVIGVPHPKWEERPLAIVVPKPEYKDKVTKEEIKEHVAKRFAKWQVPDDIIFVEEIPKTSVGKFDKKMLRGTYKDYYTSRG